MRALRASHIPGRLEESIEFCGNFTVRQETDEKLVPSYAAKACGGENRDVVERVSSACACIPKTEVPELPRTTSRPPVPTVLPP
ncbi:hypothetical protein HYQ45_018706 [Verticillium longisporum]|nr:hypothetical protein HYQ45_018706 [Verticillium longisporum]